MLVGGIAQLAFQIRPLIKLAMLPRPSLDISDPGVRRVLRAMGPAVIGVSAAQISALINTQLAALLGNGAISWITYADRLMEFPSALLGAALGTILLPSLAKHHSDANHDNDMGNFAKYSTPVVANGKVYVGTFSNKVVQYGL